MKIYNSLSRKLEEFEPLNPPNVGMYTCGPTVYDYQHIGNFRTMLLSDTLIRVLKANGYQVKSVRNITDIDDKIITGAKVKNLPIEEFSKEYTDVFFEDLNKLSILPVDVSPKATEHIEGMVKYIKQLVKKGLAYMEDDGSVYFDISKFPDYGKLSQIDKKRLKTGTRILSREARELRSSDEYTKDNVQDFALWKSVGPDEVGYDSPWGRGRPGWHIECSVMSQQYLSGKQSRTIDIHVGGVDLLFPHHENEIAQSEGKTGKPFVKYFVHGEFLLIDRQKMSKSLKNIYKLKDLEEKGFEPLAYRYLVLTVHYRDKLNFTWQSLQAAQNALNNLRQIIRGWESINGLLQQSKENVVQFWQRFMEAANNDLNMPQAVAVMWEMIRSGDTISGKSAQLFQMDKILGLELDKYLGKPVEIPEDVKKLIEHRENARKSSDFKKSDKLRHEIKKLGFEIEDTPAGPKVKGR